MEYALTTKGEKYRERLLERIDSFEKKWVKAGSTSSERPKWDYKGGSRAFILDNIYTGRPLEADIAESTSRILERGWPGRAKRYSSSMHKEIASLLKGGYIEEVKSSSTTTLGDTPTGPHHGYPSVLSDYPEFWEGSK